MISPLLALVLSPTLVSQMSCPRLLDTNPTATPRLVSRSSTVVDSRSPGEFVPWRKIKLRPTLTSSVAVCKRAGQWNDCAERMLQSSLRLETNYKLAIVKLVTRLKVQTASVATCKKNLDGRREVIVVPGEPVVTVWYYWLGERLLWFVGGGIVVGIGVLLLVN